MARILAVFALSLVLAVGIAPRETPAENSRKTNKPDPGHRQARIQFQYEEIRESKWETKSLGQLFHYGHDTESRNLSGMLVLEVPDEDLLHSFEIPGTPVSAPAQEPRTTIWNFPGNFVSRRLEVGDHAKVIQCTGTAEYRRDQEFNDKALAPHSKSAWKWYKKTRNASATQALTLEGAHTQWSLEFNSKDGLDFFRYWVLPISGTEKEVQDDGSSSTRELPEDVKLLIPPLKAPVENGWVFNRRMDSRGLEASGTLSKTEAGGSTVHGSLRVKIDLDPAEYECVITPPEDYRSWIPEGGKDEEQVGNTLQFTGEIRCLRGKPAPDRQFRVEVRVDSSTQAGVCVNFPAKGKKTADLLVQREGTSGTLELKSNEGTGQDDAWSTATGNFKVGEKFTVKVGSRDFGSFGSIHFTTDAPARIEGFKDLSSLDLPFDQNHNHIADEWEKEQGEGTSSLNDASADNDKEPNGDGVDGDGLSVYEEYRGFRIRGYWTRTDPFKKTLFIHDPQNLTYGLFYKSDLSIREVGADEFCDEEGAENRHVINCNRGYATRGPQHLLFLRNRVLPGLMGLAEGPNIGPPRETSFVSVDLVKCRNAGPGQLAGTVAHELGHGCNLHHHGESNYHALNVKYYGAEHTWRNMAGGAGDSGWVVAAVRAQCSGNDTCIMRYLTASFYEKAGGRYAWQKIPGGAYIQGEIYPDGPFYRSLFCETRKGTGINDAGHPGGSVAGNASCGGCVHQFQINDHETAKAPSCEN